MAGDEQNKTEEATPFKLAKAREKGTIARGTDLGYLASLAGLLLFLTIASTRATGLEVGWSGDALGRGISNTDEQSLPPYQPPLPRPLRPCAGL